MSGRTTAVDRFRAEAAARGLEGLEIREFPEGTRTAADAARAIGCELGQIVKSIVLMADGRAVVALTSGANRVDTEKIARILGAAEVRTADAGEAREATGFAIGGTPPFGHPTRLRVLMDRDLHAYDEVWAAAGTPTAVFPIGPQELERAAGAEVVDLKE